MSQACSSGGASCAVVIPVYKSAMSPIEEMSFVRCMRVLCRRHIWLVAPDALDTSIFSRLASEIGVELRVRRFPKKFFAGVEGYNRLMLSVDFYSAFADYDFILIYQLDAYVFSDDLDHWCSMPYDYIGAPWFANFGSCADGPLMAVGNGGFSLRRVSFFVQLLSHTGRRMFGLLHLPVEGLVNKLKYQLGGYNTIESEIQRNALNEDHFYCLTLASSLHAPRIPDPLTAARFAFERSPSYLFELVGERLPMGCHAFEKYEYLSFWQSRMQLPNK